MKPKPRIPPTPPSRSDLDEERNWPRPPPGIRYPVRYDLEGPRYRAAVPLPTKPPTPPSRSDSDEERNWPRPPPYIRYPVRYDLGIVPTVSAASQLSSRLSRPAIIPIAAPTVPTNQQLAAIYQQLAAINQQLAAINQQLAAINQRVTAIDQRVTAIEARQNRGEP